MSHHSLASEHVSRHLVYATPSVANVVFLYMLGSLASHVAGFEVYNTSLGSRHHVWDSYIFCPCSLAVLNIVSNWGLCPLVLLFPLPSAKLNVILKDYGRLSPHMYSFTRPKASMVELCSHIRSLQILNSHILVGH